MGFTTGEREELAAARLRVRELEEKEVEALDAAAHVLFSAGLRLAGDDYKWSDVIRRGADAIRDALAPFDSGYRAAEDDS